MAFLIAFAVTGLLTYLAILLTFRVVVILIAVYFWLFHPCERRSLFPKGFWRAALGTRS